MGDSDFCLRFYVEDWELFLYGAYGSNCDWILDRFLQRLGGERHGGRGHVMVGVGHALHGLAALYWGAGGGAVGSTGGGCS